MGPKCTLNKLPWLPAHNSVYEATDYEGKNLKTKLRNKGKVNSLSI